jgi:hypothetical protein
MTAPLKSGFIPWDRSDTEHFKSTMAQLETIWRAGSPLALSDAINFCREHHCVVWPHWITEALAADHQAQIAGQARSKRGRQASVGGHERDRHKHVLRWHNAKIALACRERLVADGFPPTRDGAFQWVSQLLRGTVASGENDAVERSYKKVEKAIRDGNGARFGIVRPQV